MLQDQELTRIAFDAAGVHLPAGALKRVEVKPHINSVDEVGLRLTLVIEDAEEQSFATSAVSEIMLDVADRLAEAGEEREPTFIFTTESEMAERGRS